MQTMSIVLVSDSWVRKLQQVELSDLHHTFNGDKILWLQIRASSREIKRISCLLLSELERSINDKTIRVYCIREM